jgi:hypothetical protein
MATNYYADPPATKEPYDEHQLAVYKEKWRQLIVKYLLNTGCDTLSMVGSNVTKPSQLPSMIELQEVLRSDPHPRFELLTPCEGNANMAPMIMVRLITLTDEETELLCERWRDQIANYLVSVGGCATMSTLGSVRCPERLTVKAIKLRDVLLKDPTRFKIQGFGNCITVVLRGKLKKVCTTVDDEWSTVSYCRTIPKVQSRSTLPPPIHPLSTIAAQPIAPFSQSVTFPGLFPTPPPGLTKISAVTNNEDTSNADIDANPCQVFSSVTTAGAPMALASPVVTSRATRLPTTLEDWLPIVFQGFPTALVSGFIRQLNEEGFLTVEDLQLAHGQGQLPLEYLESFGMKLGHFNRLMKGLQESLVTPNENPSSESK